MSRFDDIRNKKKQADKAINQLNNIEEETIRVANTAKNIHVIFGDIEDKFEKATKLNKTDVSFLFFATALQCVRWILMPSLELDFSKTQSDDRETSSKGGKKEKEGEKKYLEKNNGKEVIESEKYFSWKKIITSPVPYDAMAGSKDIRIKNFSTKKIGKELCGTTHHVATLGHDPIVGWIIGPLNITSRMITFCDIQTYCVEKDDKRGQRITHPSNIYSMLQTSINSWQEDNKRLFASVSKQGMHQISDKKTKMGLQIPFISPDKAQILLSKGWNSAEVEKIICKLGTNVAIVGAQVTISIIINQLIKAIHLLFYDESIHSSYSLYEVKTRKILSLSNSIASSSNIIYSAMGHYDKLDIGGIMVTLYRLVSDYRFISTIKKEFIEKELYSIIIGESYDLI